MRSRYKSPGQYKDLTSFRAHARRLDPDFDCDPAVEGQAGPLGAPIEVFGKRLANRFCTQPMEGWDGTKRGLPTAHTLRRWTRFGRSGAKLIWGGEAFAVRPDGRANANQLCLIEPADARQGLEKLRRAVQAGHAAIGQDPTELLIGLQLTHSGRYARPDGQPRPRLACHHPILDARLGLSPASPVVTDAELREIAKDYVAAARLAAAAGFDFVDVKSCHGYLLHELLGAKTRPGDYGGTFENRTRLLSEIIDAIRRACPELGIGVRVSFGDVVPFRPDAAHTGVPEPCDVHRFGFAVSADHDVFDLAEPFALLELLQAKGVHLVNLSLGSAYYCPHVLRPAAYPPSDGYLPPEDPLRGVLRHLRVARRAKQAFPAMTFVGSGYSYLQEWVAHVGQHEVRHGHVDFVGLGRMLLSYPELPRDVLAGRELDHKRICRTFSDCTTAPRLGLLSGCFPLDDYYSKLPEAEELRALKRARRN